MGRRSICTYVLPMPRMHAGLPLGAAMADGCCTTQIRDAMGNDYHKPKDVAGENRFAFTSHADSAFDVCFENSLSGGMPAFGLDHYIIS